MHGLKYIYIDWVRIYIGGKIVDQHLLKLTHLVLLIQQLTSYPSELVFGWSLVG